MESREIIRDVLMDDAPFCGLTITAAQCDFLADKIDAAIKGEMDGPVPPPPPPPPPPG